MRFVDFLKTTVLLSGGATQLDFIFTGGTGSIIPGPIPVTTSVPTVVANITASPVQDPAEIRATLGDQVTGSVRWTESIEHLIDRAGCDLFLELGPGSVLAGLVARIRKGAQVLSIGDLASLEEALPAIRTATE